MSPSPPSFVSGGDERFAVRVFGRGVITEFNGEPITDRETAWAVVRSVELMYGEACEIEQLLMSVSSTTKAAE